MPTDYILPPTELPPGSIVWTYLRDSGGDSQEQSVSQQKAEIKAYCDRHGLVLGMVFADEARSGGNTIKRDAFNDMIDISASPNNRPDGILLWNFARFARNMNQAMFYKCMLREAGIVVHSITDPIPEGEHAILIESLIDFANDQKRRQNKRDVKRALRARVKQGYTCGGFPPQGYIAEKVEIGRKRDGSPRIASKWVPDPELRELIKLAWRLRAEGKTYGEIRDATGGRIYESKNCFPTFFSNKTYLGIGKCGDLEVPNHHEALVDQETWDKVQEIQNGNPRRKSKCSGHLHHPARVANPTLLSGLAVCARCGAAMTAQTSGGWPAYICGQKARKRSYGDCQSRLVGRAKADKAVIDTVMGRILSLDFFSDLLEETRAQFADTSEMDLKLTGFQKSLADTERGINMMLAAIEKGSLSAVDRLKELEIKQARFKSEIVQLEAQIASAHVEISPEALTLALSTWCHQMDEASNTRELKNLIARFVSKIELSYNMARIWYKYPLALDQQPPLWGHTIQKTVLLHL